MSRSQQHKQVLSGTPQNYTFSPDVCIMSHSFPNLLTRGSVLGRVPAEGRSTAGLGKGCSPAGLLRGCFESRREPRICRRLPPCQYKPSCLARISCNSACFFAFFQRTSVVCLHMDLLLDHSQVWGVHSLSSTAAPSPASNPWPPGCQSPLGVLELCTFCR